MEHILFGIVGFILGSGLLYGLQQRQLDNIQLRLERAQKALQQAEKLNKQQSAQLQKFQQAKAQNDKLKEYYQAKFQGLEQSYRVRLQELQKSLKSSREITPSEEAWRETKAYEQEGASHFEQSITPSKDIQRGAAHLKSATGQKWDAIEEESDNNGPESYLINPFTSKKSEKQQKVPTPAAEFELAELLESEDTWDHGTKSQPEILNDDSDGEHTLLELFTDQETSSNELQEFLDMLESETGSEAQTKEHKSGDHSEIFD
jgi:hypothetical protein